MARYVEESEIRRMIIRRGWLDEKTLAESSVVDNLPTADVRENVHATWQDDGLIDCSTVHLYRCSCCGSLVTDFQASMYDFCPWRGKSMERSNNG